MYKPIAESYSKTPYFSCILVSRFCSVEISPHLNLAFSQPCEQNCALLSVLVDLFSACLQIYWLYLSVF